MRRQRRVLVRAAVVLSARTSVRPPAIPPRSSRRVGTTRAGDPLARAGEVHGLGRGGVGGEGGLEEGGEAEELAVALAFERERIRRKQGAEVVVVVR